MNLSLNQEWLVAYLPVLMTTTSRWRSTWQRGGTGLLNSYYWHWTTRQLLTCGQLAAFSLRCSDDDISFLVSLTLTGLHTSVRSHDWNMSVVVGVIIITCLSDSAYMRGRTTKQGGTLPLSFMYVDDNDCVCLGDTVYLLFTFYCSYFKMALILRLLFMILVTYLVISHNIITYSVISHNIVRLRMA